jgi:hypothetical protein
MNARLEMLTVLVLGVLASACMAERVPQDRKEANLVVVGTIKKITSSESKFFDDGIQTNYTAEVVVDKVEKGEDVKPGETIKVGWYRVTKSPSKPPPAAYGKSYPIKAKDKAKFWLEGSPKKGWTIIYNNEGVEKVK